MSVLWTMDNESFATAIELSLTSLMFRVLGPDFRTIPKAIAFFPQGLSTKTALSKCLFPTVSDTINVLDEFCVFSLSKQIFCHSAHAASGLLHDRGTVLQLDAD